MQHFSLTFSNPHTLYNWTVGCSKCYNFKEISGLNTRSVWTEWHLEWNARYNYNSIHVFLKTSTLLHPWPRKAGEHCRIGYQIFQELEFGVPAPKIIIIIIMISHTWPASTRLHSSVGRVSHWHHSHAMGSNPVGASEFFMGFILTASLLQLTARIDHFHFQVSLLNYYLDQKSRWWLLILWWISLSNMT